MPVCNHRELCADDSKADVVGVVRPCDKQIQVVVVAGIDLKKRRDAATHKGSSPRRSCRCGRRRPGRPHYQTGNECRHEPAFRRLLGGGEKAIDERSTPGMSSDPIVKCRFGPNSDERIAAVVPLNVAWPDVYDGKGGYSIAESKSDPNRLTRH